MAINGSYWVDQAHHHFLFWESRHLDSCDERSRKKRYAAILALAILRQFHSHLVRILHKFFKDAKNWKLGRAGILEDRRTGGLEDFGGLIIKSPPIFYL